MNDFYAPMTKEEAHRRIEEAERGIAEGRVVPREEVMRRSFELLKKYGGKKAFCEKTTKNLFQLQIILIFVVSSIIM